MFVTVRRAIYDHSAYKKASTCTQGKVAQLGWGVCVCVQYLVGDKNKNWVLHYSNRCRNNPYTYLIIVDTFLARNYQIQIHSHTFTSSIMN